MTNQPSHGDVQPDARGSDGVGTIGRDLRARREALGEDLADIAEILCIRLDYLRALEAGDYDALPGAAYAVGFVRTYAWHLGMDGDELAGQFKMEISGESPTAKLDFLTPVQESRIPRGAIMLVTALLAVAIYGVWYYMNARELTFADIIPEVPSQLERAAEAPAPATNTPAEPSSAAPAGEEAAVPRQAKPVDGGNAAGPVAGVSPVPSEPGLGRESAGPSVPVKPAPRAALPTPAEPTSAAPDRGAPSAASTEPAPAHEGAVETPPVVSENAAVPPAAPAGTTATASPAPPPAKAPPRIEIRAKEDSWVQVRTGDGTLLMTRIVAKGTGFVLPPQEGLTLTTGNAGGLEILVDGVVVPSLGPSGAVRRGVSLDPERLKAGAAAAR